jgi:hypothetical protein
LTKAKTLDVCKEIMKAIAERGYTNQIHKRELEKIIMVIRGNDPRTIKNWLKTLFELGFIEYVNPLVIKLNFSQCPELLNLVVKNGQKRLM